MEITDVYIGCEESLGEQVQAIYDYSHDIGANSVLLSAIGSFQENLVKRATLSPEIIARCMEDWKCTHGFKDIWSYRAFASDLIEKHGL